MKKIVLIILLIMGFGFNIFAVQRKYMSIPVLCYHHITKYSGSRIDRSNYRISVRKFKAQMKYLYSAGFKTVSLNKLCRFIKGYKVSMPEKPVVITFDDGLKSQFKNAVPVLRKYGFTGVFFIYPSVIMARGRVYRKYYVTRNMIRKLHSLGMEVESHSFYHPLMHKSSRKDNITQFKYSKKWLEKIVPKKIRFFAYPFGSYTRSTNRMAVKYGYRGLFSINNSPVYKGSNELSINRYMVGRKHSLRVFKLYVNARALRISRYNPLNGGVYRKIKFISIQLKDNISKQDYRFIALVNGRRARKYYYNQNKRLFFFYPRKLYRGLNTVQIILKHKYNRKYPRLITSWSFVYLKRGKRLARRFR